MRKKVLLFVTCLFMNYFFSFYAQGAQEDSPAISPVRTEKTAVREKMGGRWMLYGDIGGRVNPLGLGFFGGVNYRDVYRYDKKRNMQAAYWQTGIGAGVSPSAASVSVHAEWMPWIVMPLRIEYDYYRFFGAGYGLLSFDSPQASLNEDRISERKDQEAANGHRFFFQPTFQGKIGPVILRNQTDLAYFTFSGRGPYFLELEYFTLLKDGDWLVSNRTQALMEFRKGSKGPTLLAGPYYEVTRARDAQITQQKVGALLYWMPREKLASLDRPHVGLKLAYQLQDPERQGQLYVQFAVGFEFDLH
jgi:hypothetical protein